MFKLIHFSNNLESLEKIDLKYLDKDLFFDSQNVLKLLNFLNTKFINLKFLTLEFVQFISIVDEVPEGVLISPSKFLEAYMNYEKNLNVENKRVKIKLSYLMDKTFDFPKKAIEDYSQKLKTELRSFEYSSQIENNKTGYNFKKSSNIVENFELNIDICLDCNSVLSTPHRVS